MRLPVAALLALAIALAGCTAPNATVDPATPIGSGGSVAPAPGTTVGGAATAPPTPMPGARLQVELASVAPWSNPNGTLAKAASFYVWGATSAQDLAAAQFVLTLADGQVVNATSGSATPIATRTDGWGDVYAEGETALPRTLPVTVKPGMTLRVDVEYQGVYGWKEPVSLGYGGTFTFPTPDERVEDDGQLGNGYR